MVFSTPFGNFSTLEATISGDQLLLTGGRDDRPIDGDGFRFDVRAAVVPEPASTLLAVWSAVLLAISKTRRERPRRPEQAAH